MNKKSDSLSIIFLICLISLILPLFLIPVEKIAPYPHIIEEFVKAILIYIVLKKISSKSQLLLTLVIICLFALSENMFYLINFIVDGIFYNFWQRFILTTTLHILTGLIIFLPSQKNKKFIIPATLLAIIVHFLYNQIVLSILR